MARSQCEQLIIHALDRFDLPRWKIHQCVSGRFASEDIERARRALVAAGMVVEVGKTRRGTPIYGLRGRRRDA